MLLQFQLINEPTDGGLYYTVRHIVPIKYVPIVAWFVGWINLLGQIACSASVVFAMASQITALASLISNYTYIPPNSHNVGCYMGCLVVVGLLNSLPTKWLARLTSAYTVVNIGGMLAAIIGLPIACKDKNTASFVFTNFENNSGWSNNGISFLLGLLAVAWTMTDYDATAHITEEVENANVRAPIAIIIAVATTAVLGWILFIVMVLCMGTDIQALLNAPSGLPVVLIYYRNFGKGGAIAFLVLTIIVQLSACQSCTQACARSIFAFSRDDLLPWSHVWRKVNKTTHTPLYAVWLIIFISAILGLLDLASYYAANAIFAVTSIALDWSYVIPVICKVIFEGKTSYTPGPIHLGRWSKPINVFAFVWVLFVSVILCFPQSMPVEKQTMNYASVVFLGWMLLSGVYWIVKHSFGKEYLGPGVKCVVGQPVTQITQQLSDEKKDEKKD